MRLFDTHCHLDDEQFATSLVSVLENAAAAGVVQVVAVGTTAGSSEVCVGLARRFPLVSAAVGIQPNYVAAAEENSWEQVVALTAEPGVVAIGETGLDRYWDYTPFPQQQDFFARHLELSAETGLPFIVHMRDCDQEILQMLRDARHRGPLNGVMHSFTGSAETARECVDLGLFISFAGMVTYKKYGTLREIAAAVPAERLLIETDAPYLSPHPKRGQRPNEPALVRLTADCLAEVRGTSSEELAELTTQNACRLFGIDIC